MADITAGREADTPPADSEHHEYHSAVEVDESVDNWRDWVGPGLAIAFLLAAIVVLILMMTGQL